MESLIIGIAGGSGSGKSTFTNRIKKRFGDDVVVLYHDNYYRRQDGIPFEQRVTVNYDHPDSLETELLVEHLKLLRQGKAIDCPVYDYSQHNRSDKILHIGISAAERLEHITRDELAGMLYENSDEPYCEELAKAITDEIRKGNHMDTTTKLRQVIEKTLDFLPEKEKKETIKKTCQRTFQALRIDVNREFEVLYEFMEKLPGALKPGGRAAILTFHSGEDKLVKKALKAGYKEGIYSDYSRDVIRPSAQECAQNGRARSTKMRWAIKSE